MSAVIAAALFAQLVVVGGDPAVCRAHRSTVERPVGAMTLRELLEVMSRNDCVRYLVPEHLLGTALVLPQSMAVVKDWRGPLRAKLDELGIKLATESVLRVDGPAAPPAAAPITDEELDRGITCTTSVHCVIARKLLDRLLADTSLLATSARIVPAVHDGRAEGLKIYALRPHSFWPRLRFENGDTILTINDMDLSSPERALEMYTKLRSTNDLTVRIVRRGQPLTLTYEIR